MGYELAVWAELDIRDTLSSDNLATEHRWERLVLESLLSCPEIDRVYSVLPIWKSPKPMPLKFINGIDSSKLNGLVVVCPNGWPMHLRPKGFAFNAMYSCYLTYPQYLAAEQACGGNILIFNPFDDYSRKLDLNSIPAFRRYSEPFFLPRIPAVQISSQPEFNSILFWPHKGLLSTMKYSAVDMRPIFDWVASKLQANPKLEFHILTASSRDGLIAEGYVPDPISFFWNHSSTSNLRAVSNRVVLHFSLDWTKVLEIYSRTLLTISSLRGGAFETGAAQESAMYGIPFVVTSPDTSSLYPSQWAQSLACCRAAYNSPEYFQLMDRLLVDRDFYNQVSSLVRSHVQRYTYESFNSNLLMALKRRGMI